MNFNEELNNIKNKIEECKAENEPVSTEIVISDKEPENVATVENKDYSEPKMTQEQANAVMNIASKPKEFLGTKISAEINELIENSQEMKGQIKDLAKDTAQTGMQTLSVDNKKQQKSNYFELNEKDITPLGGDKTSSKGQQVSIVLIRRFLWILFMAAFGFFYIAPLTVMVELFQGIAFKTIEKEEVTDGETKKVKHYIKRTKLGYAGTIIGFVIGLALCGVIGVANYFFPYVFLILASGVFTFLLLVNLLCGINISKISTIFKNKIKEAAKNNADSKTTIEVEEV
ncbi:MAG: hypothetical protein IKI95_05835 [Clostridia bacterium]|nr:hypothetical protein [Clostridia bacterium]